jgi:hypothetical protein
MTFKHAPAVLAFLLCATALVPAESSIRIQFRDGRLWISARDASVRDILREWAKLGGVKIVNGDHVIGPPITLELDGVFEREALAVLLRDAAGYVVAARADGSNGPSEFDRIVVLPTSRIDPALANAAPTAPPPEEDDKPAFALPDALADLIRAGSAR